MERVNINLLGEGEQAESVRRLKNILNYLHRHYGGTLAAAIVATKLKEAMPIPRAEIRRINEHIT